MPIQMKRGAPYGGECAAGEFKRGVSGEDGDRDGEDDEGGRVGVREVLVPQRERSDP